MSSPPIHGFVAPGFEPVRDAFERNFIDFAEQGASVTVYVDGKTQVDLWGGTADINTGSEWNEDSLALVFSVTKGAVAALCSVLVEQQRLDLDATVASYWPEFGCNGKSATTVRQVLCHQAGLPIVEAMVTRQELLEPGRVASLLAQQTPMWQPGTAHGYHGLTFGSLVGEIIKRATGFSVGELMASEVAIPLGIELFIGLPEETEARVAPLVDRVPLPGRGLLDYVGDSVIRDAFERLARDAADPDSSLSRMVTSNGALPTPVAQHWNGRDIHAAEMPGANGITNSRSLAKLYAACIGEVDGKRLLSDSTLAMATQPLACGADVLQHYSNSFGVGFQLPCPVQPLFSAASFGHQGASGALGFGDTDF